MGVGPLFPGPTTPRVCHQVHPTLPSLIHPSSPYLILLHPTLPNSIHPTLRAYEIWIWYTNLFTSSLGVCQMQVRNPKSGSRGFFNVWISQKFRLIYIYICSVWVLTLSLYTPSTDRGRMLTNWFCVEFIRSDPDIRYLDPPDVAPNSPDPVEKTHPALFLTHAPF